MPDTHVDIVNLNIKEVVKEKYGQAALARHQQDRRQQLLRRRRRRGNTAIRSQRISMTTRRPGRFPKKRCWLRLDAGTQPAWRS